MDSNDSPTYNQLRNVMDALDEHDDSINRSLNIPTRLHVANDDINYDDESESSGSPEVQELDSNRISKESEHGDNRKHKGNMLHEQDRLLPIANVTRVMRGQIPASGKMAKEAKELVQDCVSEFISFITSHANDRCLDEKRKVITSDDLLDALKELGFDEYVDPMEIFLHRYRTETGKHGTARPNSGRNQETLTTVHVPNVASTSVTTHQEQQEFLVQPPTIVFTDPFTPDPQNLQPTNCQILVDPNTGQHYLAQPGDEEGELELMPINLSDQMMPYMNLTTIQETQLEGEPTREAPLEPTTLQEVSPSTNCTKETTSPNKRSPSTRQNSATNKRPKFS